MRAAIRRVYGPPATITLKEVKQPIPKANEVLVKVHATTVNRTDCANLTAQPFIMRFILGWIKPRKIILGTDIAGEVIAIGEEVKRFKLGDRVFGFSDLGLTSQAELAVVQSDLLFLIPAKIDFATAAASLEGAHYAYSFNHKVQIRAGQKILINGATGAIGSALLQFIAPFNIEITATCNTKNLKRIQSLGAHRVVDYTREDFTQLEEQFDIVFDAVGKSTLGKCKPILKKGGIYISSELGPYAQNVFLAFLPLLSGNNKVVFPIPFDPKKTIPYIMDQMEQNIFTPVIDRIYRPDQIVEAYEYVISGQKTGNVIVKWQHHLS